MPDRVDARCSDCSRAAGEQLAGTATTVDEWLLLEVPGSWPRDVGSGDGAPDRHRAAAERWLGATTGRRLVFVRRPGRTGLPLAFVVTARESERAVRRVELEPGAVSGVLDFEVDGEPVDAQLVLVCGHGSRDACCALRGTAVYGALADRLGDDELWISSHQGGHRFAANVLVLPAGLHLGRVEPDEAPVVVARALAGRIDLARYRGRTCYPPHVQAAEHAIRTACGLERASELELAAVEDGLVRFRALDGSEHRARVAEVGGPLVPSSCGDEPEPQRAFVATTELALSAPGGASRP